MFLGVDKLEKLVRDVNLVEGLDDRELNNPEGTGYDLRAGRISKFQESSAFLGVKNRKTLRTEVVCEVNKNSSELFTLHPGEYCLVTTIEKVNMPLELVGIIRPRGTLFRSGIMLMTGQVNPGYSGEQTFGMYNASPFEFELEMGSRIAHILFAEIEGESAPYRGQWNNGRISVPNIEEQV
jgi:deoxycytidine triphosphate deaminase